MQEAVHKINELSEKLNKVLSEMPNARRELHEEIKDLLKKEVDANIDASLSDFHGKIKNWQEAEVGSGGGYAAVRAKKGETGDDSPGAITNYLEGGHKIRTPSGKNKYYKPRIKKVYVDGFHFYAKTRQTIEAKVISIAEDFADDIIRSLDL